MGKSILVYIQAYNAEKVVHRAIESILSQTYDNFICWVCDNGSNDKTMEVIKKYALRDRRIIPFFNEKNDTHTLFKRFLPMIINNYSSSVDWFCNLDADDEYDPDFFEKIISFVSENQLDVATCGTNWVSEKTQKIIRRKLIDESIILEGREFAEYFPIYRNFMVTIWGAIYSLDLLEKCSFEWSKNAINFGDTAFVMEAFQKSKRAGILAECLHKYNIMPETGSYQFNPDWFKACKYIHKISTDYLLDYGEISKQNQDYLCVLYLILIKYILPRIQSADVNLLEKLKCLDEIFSDKSTQHILKNWHQVGIYSDRGEFLSDILGWIKSQDGWEKECSTVEKIASFMNI